MRSVKVRWLILLVTTLAVSLAGPASAQGIRGDVHPESPSPPVTSPESSSPGTGTEPTLGALIDDLMKEVPQAQREEITRVLRKMLRLHRAVSDMLPRIREELRKALEDPADARRI